MVFTVSLDFVSGASSRSTLVSVVVLDSPAGIVVPVGVGLVIGAVALGFYVTRPIAATLPAAGTNP